MMRFYTVDTNKTNDKEITLYEKTIGSFQYR